MAVVVFLFLLYQLYGIYRGKTQNESFKWDDLDDRIKHDPVFFGDKQIQNVSEFTNIYDKGMLFNL